MQKGNENNLSEAGIETALSNLPRVEAPVNFEAMVRSRIAEGLQTSWQPGWGLGLKFALPTIALVALGAFFVFSGGSNVGEQAVAPVSIQNTLVAETAVLPDAPGEAAGLGGKGNQLTSRAVNAGQRNSNLGNVVDMPLIADAPGGGSRDTTLNQADPSIYPKGVDPNTKPDIRNLKPPGGNGISAEMILSMLGIKSDCKENGCLATAIANQSIAEKAGVKANDMIEAIDEKPVKAGTVFEGAISVRSLRVLRGGKRITISLNTSK